MVELIVIWLLVITLLFLLYKYQKLIDEYNDLVDYANNSLDTSKELMSICIEQQSALLSYEKLASEQLGTIKEMNDLFKEVVND